MDSTIVFRVQGSGDLESRLRMGIIGVTIWFIRVINLLVNLLAKSP